MLSDLVWVGANNNEIPQAVTKLLGNYPNPFNPSTTISFSVAQTSSFVNLEIYNMKGQKVKQLVNGPLSAGRHCVVWDHLFITTFSVIRFPSALSNK